MNPSEMMQAVIILHKVSNMSFRTIQPPKESGREHRFLIFHYGPANYTHTKNEMV